MPHARAPVDDEEHLALESGDVRGCVALRVLASDGTSGDCHDLERLH